MSSTSRPSLVLVTALGSDQRLWQPVVDRLGDTLECIVVRPVGDTIAAMADDLLARAPRHFVLAGISMGSYVALEVVLRGTGRVRAAALINSTAAEASPERRAGALRLVTMMRSGQFAEAVDLMTKAVAPARPDVTTLASAMAHDLGSDALVEQQVAVLNRADRTAELGAIDVPTLIVAGEEDAINPPELASQLATAIHDAVLVVLPGVGHLSSLEAPDALAAALLTWWSTIEASEIQETDAHL